MPWSTEIWNLYVLFHATLCYVFKVLKELSVIEDYSVTLFPCCVYQAEAVTLTVSQAFNLAKEEYEEEQKPRNQDNNQATKVQSLKHVTFVRSSLPYHMYQYQTLGYSETCI